MKFIRCLHLKFKRKAAIVLFLYMMGFGYMYSNFLGSVSSREHYARLYYHYVDMEPALGARQKFGQSKVEGTSINQIPKENILNPLRDRNMNKQNGAIGIAIIDLKRPASFVKRGNSSFIKKNIDNLKNLLEGENKNVMHIAPLHRSNINEMELMQMKQMGIKISDSSQTGVPFVNSNSKDVKISPNAQKGDSKGKKSPVQKLNLKDIKKSSGIKKNEKSLKKSYLKSFSYPLEIDLQKLVREIDSGKAINGTKNINPHPFHFLYTPSHSCEYKPNITNTKVVIIVKSKAENFERRNTIRHTWAKLVPNHVHLVFLLGLPKNGNLGVRKESSQYGYIVQEDFIDDYRNNTVKMIMGFKWSILYCQQAKYLFFVDDDYYVNVPNLLTYLKTIKGSGQDTLFSGTLLPQSVPYRTKGSKWYISWEDYPFDRWPPYLAGGAYFVSVALARKFYLAFPYVQPMHIDDVYLGIVAKKLGIRPKSCSKIGYTKRQQHSLKSVIASHGYAKKEEVERAWAALSQDRAKQVPVRPRIKQNTPKRNIKHLKR